MSFMRPFCLALCSRALERGGIPLHDAVGINCKKGATTEHQGACVKYMGLGMYVGHYYPSLVEGESHGI